MTRAEEALASKEDSEEKAEKPSPQLSLTNPERPPVVAFLRLYGPLVLLVYPAIRLPVLALDFLAFRLIFELIKYMVPLFLSLIKPCNTTQVITWAIPVLILEAIFMALALVLVSLVFATYFLDKVLRFYIFDAIARPDHFADNLPTCLSYPALAKAYSTLLRVALFAVGCLLIAGAFGYVGLGLGVVKAAMMLATKAFLAIGVPAAPAAVAAKSTVATVGVLGVSSSFWAGCSCGRRKEREEPVPDGGLRPGFSATAS